MIDCGHKELFLEDICPDITTLESYKLYAIKEYKLKSFSFTKVVVSVTHNKSEEM